VVAAKTTWEAAQAMALMATMAAPAPLILAPAAVEVRARWAATGLAELAPVLEALAALVCLTRILAPVCFMAGAVAAQPCHPALVVLEAVVAAVRLLALEITVLSIQGAGAEGQVARALAVMVGLA
jgi:hypothetical protein